MSSLVWRLRRLRAMGLVEILHRTRRALLNRLPPPPYLRWTPEEAYSHLIDENTEQLIAEWPFHLHCSSLDEIERAHVLEDAEALVRGEWVLFGRKVALDSPPRWNANPMTGNTWPDAPSKKIDYHDTKLAGDPKFTWELGRLTWLPTLAIAYEVTQDDKFKERLNLLLSDFLDRNPVGWGIHHTSGIEMGVRNLTISLAISACPSAFSEPNFKRSVGFIAQQALWLRSNLSLGSSANNHLLAEASGMAVAALCAPNSRRLTPLRNLGLRLLRAELLKQVNADGGPAEHSFEYLPFILELFLIPFAMERAAGRGNTAPSAERLHRSLEFLRAVLLPDGGLPKVGDQDDARVALPMEAFSRARLVANALAAFLGQPAVSSADTALARLMFGETPHPKPPQDLHREFEASGYTLWRRDPWMLLLDHGDLGYLSLAAHGHADALSICLYHGSTPVIADPGMAHYHDDLESRDRLRSTPAHATVSFDGRSQSEMLGPFLWGRRANICRQSQGFECAWYTGEIHWRSVVFESNLIRIEDKTSRPGGRIHFPLGPSCSVEFHEDCALVSWPGGSLEIRGKGIGEWTLHDSLFAPRFSHTLPTKSLSADMNGLEATIEIRLAEAPC
ncbi:MAG: alginate lyase family protein [Armatimonadetes bacterium]|nr:hypothetical protein [Armatimonadota bacterium]NOG92450.1 alginate lyase family protein [Armatimonadota bacterium]